jgi:hypothetical protein
MFSGAVSLRKLKNYCLVISHMSADSLFFGNREWLDHNRESAPREQGVLLLRR